MRVRANQYVIAFILATLALSSSPGWAAAPDRMMQACQVRAHEIMHARIPDIETKYEGQRTNEMSDPAPKSPAEIETTR